MLSPLAESVYKAFADGWRRGMDGVLDEPLFPRLQKKTYEPDPRPIKKPKKGKK